MEQSQSNDTSQQKDSESRDAGGALTQVRWTLRQRRSVPLTCRNQTASDSNKTFRWPHIARLENSKQMRLSIIISLKSTH